MKQFHFIRPNSTLVLPFLNHTFVLSCLLIVINPNQQQVAMIILQTPAILLFLNLGNRSFCTFVPFEFHHKCRFIREFLPRQKYHIGKPLSCWQFPVQCVKIPCRISCNRAANCTILTSAYSCFAISVAILYTLTVW